MKDLLKTFTLCSALLLVTSLNAQTNQKYNPYKSIGQEAEILTLSKGKYVEFFDLDSIEIIGDAILNTNTMKVVGFVERDTLYSEATMEPEIVSRWWAPDPVMQPHQSPYLFVANNPIIYVDQTGEDNVIYLVALPSSSPEFEMPDVKKIAETANNNFRNLGLNTRVVVFESNQPFDPAHLDPNDSYALIGSSGDITSAVSGAGYTSEIRQAARALSSTTRPEESATSFNKFEQGILIESSRVSTFARETGSDNLGAAAFLIVHGAGHNAGINKHVNDFGSRFDNADIMFNGDFITSNYSGTLSSFLTPSSNSFFTERLSNDAYFGNNDARDNYAFKNAPWKVGATNPNTVDETTPGYGVLKNTPSSGDQRASSNSKIKLPKD